MSDDEDGVHKLSGYNNTEGGLIIKKKPKPAEQFQFKIPDVPKGSLLGLDKLAGKYSNIVQINNYFPLQFLLSIDQF